MARVSCFLNRQHNLSLSSAADFLCRVPNIGQIRWYSRASVVHALVSCRLQRRLLMSRAQDARVCSYGLVDWWSERSIANRELNELEDR